MVVADVVVLSLGASQGFPLDSLKEIGRGTNGMGDSQSSFCPHWGEFVWRGNWSLVQYCTNGNCCCVSVVRCRFLQVVAWGVIVQNSPSSSCIISARSSVKEASQFYPSFHMCHVSCVIPHVLCNLQLSLRIHKTNCYLLTVLLFIMYLLRIVIRTSTSTNNNFASLCQQQHQQQHNINSNYNNNNNDNEQ